MNNSLIRVLLADDQQMLLAMYRSNLQEGFDIVGECKTAEDLITKYKEMPIKPNVILTDIRFGVGSNGFDAIEQILKYDPLANFVVMSQFDKPAYIHKAFKLGAKSFVSKDCEPEILVEAVKTASLGHKYVPQAISLKLVDYISTPQDSDPTTALNPEQLKIFMLIAEGKTNSEVAEILKVKPNTISIERQKIGAILKIDRPQDFTLLAVKSELIKID